MFYNVIRKRLVEGGMKNHHIIQGNPTFFLFLCVSIFWQRRVCQSAVFFANSSLYFFKEERLCPVSNFYQQRSNICQFFSFLTQ